MAFPARKAGCMNKSDDRTPRNEEEFFSGAGSRGSSLSAAASIAVVGVRKGSRSEGVGSVDKLLKPFGVHRGFFRSRGHAFAMTVSPHGQPAPGRGIVMSPGGAPGRPGSACLSSAGTAPAGVSARPGGRDDTCVAQIVNSATSGRPIPVIASAALSRLCMGTSDIYTG